MTTHEQTTEAERAVLSSFMICEGAGDAAADAFALLGDTGAMFEFAPHAALYAAIQDINGKGRRVDPSLILADESNSDAMGGVGYVSEMLGVAATSANVLHYAEHVRRFWLLREFGRIGADLNRIATADTLPSPEEASAFIDTQLLALANCSGAKQEVIETPKGFALGVEWLGRLTQAVGGVMGVQSGINALDGLTGGFQKGDFIILAARPSVGKTAIALNFAAQAAFGDGVPVLFISLEMSASALWTRILSIECGVNVQVIKEASKKGTFAPQEVTKALSAEERITKENLHVLDTPGLTFPRMRSAVRRWAAKHPGGLVVLDYIQLLRGGGKAGQKRYEIVGDMSVGIKALAREADIPFVVLAQLSREADGVMDGHRLLSCLRESGNLEQDADVVICLALIDDDHRAAAKARGMTLQGDVILHLAKQRNGPTGEIALYFEKVTQRFRDVNEYEENTARAKRAEPKKQTVFDDDPVPMPEYEEDDTLI